jgi:hypothetical protein
MSDKHFRIFDTGRGQGGGSGNTPVAWTCKETPKALPYIFSLKMSVSQNTITIPIGNKEPHEFLCDLHKAISRTKMMVFERRELDIGEPETYALYVLTDLQQRIVSNRNT